MPIINEDILPRKHASLDQAGLRKLLEIAKSSPALARIAAEELAENPRAAIERLFRMSDSQRNSIANTPDEDLRERVSSIVALLQAGAFQPEHVLFDPGRGSAPGAGFEFARSKGGSADMKVKCDCHITIES